jgi:hypothetical protein
MGDGWQTNYDSNYYSQCRWRGKEEEEKGNPDTEQEIQKQNRDNPRYSTGC